jgi:hypothetical protein
MVPSARKAAIRMGLPDCIDRAAAPQGLLSFRYIDGLVLKISTDDDWESCRDKVAAGMNPAAIAALVWGDGNPGSISFR